MEWFLKWLAGLGDEKLPPGESLRFELASFPRGGLALLVLAGFVVAIAYVIWVYRRDAARLSPGRRALLAACRLLALSAVGLVLLEPTLVRIRRTVRPGETLILLDVSQSMGHRDRYARSPGLADAWRALGAEDPSAETRLALARRLLDRSQAFSILAAKNRVRPFVFGAALRPMPELAAQASEPAGRPGVGPLGPPPKPDWSRIQAADGRTDLTGALRRALEEVRGARLAAVLVVTDGRLNAGGSPEEAGAQLKRRRVPAVLVAGVGDPAETWSVDLRDVLCAERIFKGDPLKVSAVITAQGYDRRTVDLRLKLAAQNGDGRVLAHVPVEIGGGISRATAAFPPVKLEREGTHLLVVELEPPEGEPFEPERHRRTHKVQVLGAQLRVLIVAGGPSHEFRTLKNQFIRDDTIHVATWLQSAAKDFPQDGNEVLKSLPVTKEALDRWDVVVLVDPDPVLLPPEFARNLAEAVTERGTGLMYVAGETHTLAAVKPASPLDPIVELLPIVPDLSTAEREIGYGRYYRTPWPWTLTPEGREHRILRLLDDPVANETHWRGLPGFFWSFPVLAPKPGALVLIRHPNPLLASGEGPRPLLATHFVGAGRVSYLGTDETYRWFGTAEKSYEEFWVKGVRYLAEGRLAGGGSRVRIGLSADRVLLGKPIQVFLRALDEKLEPVVADSLAVRLTGPGGRSAELELKPTGRPGRYAGRFLPDALGVWRVHPPAELGAGRPVSFEVKRSVLESKGPMDRAVLERFARAAGGRLVDPKALAAALAEVPTLSQTNVFVLPFPLWDSWLTLAAVVVLLSIEWVLRKRWNLL